MPIGATTIDLEPDTLVNLNTSQTLVAGEDYGLHNLSGYQVFYSELARTVTNPDMATIPKISLESGLSSETLNVASDSYFYVWSPGRPAKVTLYRKG